MARVLVAEDDTPTATLIADELGDVGHLVDVVSNGADALESLEAYRPDVIVLDLMLPTVHGWAFIERYCEVTHGQDIPIVVVSAAGAVTRSMEALGVRHFLPKPFEVADLVDAVETSSPSTDDPRQHSESRASSNRSRRRTCAGGSSELAA